jgi:glutathione S-transferase
MAKPTLIEGDATATRQIRFKDRMLDLYLNDSVVTLLFQSMKPEKQRDQERIERAKSQIGTIYSFMEHELGQQAYAAGDNFTMADCAAAPALFYAQQMAPFEGHENISAYWDRLKARPSVQRVQDEAAPAIAAFMEQSAA